MTKRKIGDGWEKDGKSSNVGNRSIILGGNFKAKISECVEYNKKNPKKPFLIFLEPPQDILEYKQNVLQKAFALRQHCYNL